MVTSRHALMAFLDRISEKLPTAPWRRLFGPACAALVVTGVLYFFGAVIAEQALRPMYDPVQRTISELAVGRYGYLQVSAFVALGLSLWALAVVLHRRLHRTLLTRLCVGALALCGVASFIAGAFPTDLRHAAIATVSGQVHSTAASVGYGLLVVTMLVLSVHFRRDHRWRSYHLPSLALTLIGMATLIALGAETDGPLAGMLQRLMVVPLLLWVMLTAVRAATVPRPTAALVKLPPQ